jgi:predicted DsbA family dithiol-disulfide isomerase
LQAHRLVFKAKTLGLDNEIHDILFRMMYEEGYNISLLEPLIRAGQELGIPDVETFLKSDEFRDEVLQEDCDSKQKMRISGVPHFIVDHKISIGGSQSPSVFLRVFRGILDGREEE